VHLEGKLKKFNDLIGTQTRDIPACSITPQPSTPLSAPIDSDDDYKKALGNYNDN
jgi:hypothetical protein